MPLAKYLGLEHSPGLALALSAMLVTMSVVLLGMPRYLEKNVHY
jgi:hypothetical protein